MLGDLKGFARFAPRPREAHMTPASIELDELQLVPYRAPPMLELTCATVPDVSYWCVAELTSRSEASFIRATGSRERCDVVKHARRNQIGELIFIFKYFKIMI